jgi:hypothetical protein
MHTFRRTLWATLLIALAAGPAGAADFVNLLQNAGFDTNIAGWSTGAPNGAASWSGLDRSGNPASGSLQGAEGAAAASTSALVAWQCIPIVTGHSYVASFDYFIPSGQANTGQAQIEQDFFTDTNCTTAAGSYYAYGNIVGAWVHLATSVFNGGEVMHSIRVGVRIIKVEAGGTFIAYADNVRFFSTPCFETDTTICVNEGRFAVSATWHTNGGGSGQALGFERTSDTAAFWFFDRNNIEMLVKVLDGCGLNNRFWVYAGGLTDVGVDLTVTDTKTSATHVYNNPLNHGFDLIRDTATFGGCP